MLNKSIYTYIYIYIHFFNDEMTMTQMNAFKINPHLF